MIDSPTTVFFSFSISLVIIASVVVVLFVSIVSIFLVAFRVGHSLSYLCCLSSMKVHVYHLRRILAVLTMVVMEMSNIGLLHCVIWNSGLYWLVGGN